MSIESLNNLLSGEIKVTPVGSKNKGIMRGILIAFCLATGSGVLYVHDKLDGTVSTKDTNVVNAIKGKIQETIQETMVGKKSLEKKSPEKIKNSLYGNYISDPNMKKQIELAGNFDIPGGMKNNQVSRYVSQIQFKENNYFLPIFFVWY